MNTGITYTFPPDDTNIVVVKDNDRVVGSIRPVMGGYAYLPKGWKTYGETYASIGEVQESLEGSDDPK